MKASIVDLRYHMSDIMRALERNEDVSILSRGQLKGIIKPAGAKSRRRASDHPFFGMLADSETVDQQMDRLRGGRHRDL